MEKGFYVDRRSKETRAVRWNASTRTSPIPRRSRPFRQGRSPRSAPSFRRVPDAPEDRTLSRRTLVPKTLIFCKDDSHAEDTVHLVFGRSSVRATTSAKKITYKTYNLETKLREIETLIQEVPPHPSSGSPWPPWT